VTNAMEFDPIAYINEPRWQQVSLGLDRTYELMERLGNPQDGMRFVHVAGTNGKGSTCAFVAQILQDAGYKVGLFTSPYIITFEERIRVNGQNIPLDRLRDITLQVKECAEAMEEHPTEFELMTAVGFLYFAQEGCDICVVEVGLGGRLDSTNIIANPDVCVITPIALDHTGMLGDTLAKIASEKAGIIKQGSVVVSAAQEPEAAQVIAQAAQQQGCELRQVNLDRLRGNVAEFSYKDYTDLISSLLGVYQIQNAALAIEIIEALRTRGWDITDEALRTGLATTRWPGRFERVRTSPDVIIDGGHNEQGAQALADCLEAAYPGRKVHFVLGILADKDYQAMVRILVPYAESVTCVTPPSPRALDAVDLAATVAREAEAVHSHISVRVAQSFDDAFQVLFRRIGSDDVVVECGSLYSIAHALQALEAVDIW